VIRTIAFDPLGRQVRFAKDQENQRGLLVAENLGKI
jgi:hypothetical protein